MSANEKERRRSEGMSIPTAILLGAAIISFGVYRGLSARAPAAAPSVVASSSVSPPAPAPASASAVALSPQVAASDRQAAIDERARMALEKERAALNAKCWLPFVADGGPRQSLYKVEVWFDASGKETRRDVFLVPDAESRADALKCLRAWDTKLSIVVPPSLAGQAAAEVKATFELPFP